MKNEREGRRLLSALTLATLAACTSPTDPMAEPFEPVEPVEPTYAYAVDVETRYIKVLGSCDKDIFGDEVPGEFQYYIVVAGPGGDRTPQYSRGYNEATGAMWQRNAGTTINFTNRTHGWTNLTSPGGIRIRFQAAEWDGLRKDSDMANRGATLPVEYELGTRTRRFTLGATSRCQVSLYYDVTWTRTEVG